MPFFLPRRLIEFEYLEGDEQPSEYESKLRKEYRVDIEFAWFAVNLGYDREQFDMLTQREIAFIKKEWENKVVFDTTMMFKAIMTGFANAYKKKGGRPKKIWEKLKGKQLAQEEVATRKKELEIAKQIAKKSGTDWIKKIR